MSGPGCARTWQAEAIEDGRLGGAERVSFERHAAGCSVCAAEVAALAALRETMQHIPVLTSTPIEQQRLRAALLRRANEAMLGTSARPTRTWIALGASAAALCLVLVGAQHLLSRTQSPRGPSASRTNALAPKFEIASEQGAQWSERSAGAVGRAVLTRGTVAVHVPHLAPGQRFLLDLPDGEIEVHGTRFVVAIERDRTGRVEVTEGVVSLRVRGQPERLLHAGSRWERAPIATSAPAAQPVAVAAVTRTTDAPSDARQPPPLDARQPPSAAALRDMPVVEVTPSKGAATLRRATRTLPSRSAPGSETATQQPLPEVSAPPRADRTPVASLRFAEAVAAFHAGAYQDAETRLAQFAHDFPQDPRGEDAAFLRAVACHRMGDTQRAATLAREYLERFPHGLRHNEAERIAGGGSTR